MRGRSSDYGKDTVCRRIVSASVGWGRQTIGGFYIVAMKKVRILYRKGDHFLFSCFSQKIFSGLRPVIFTGCFKESSEKYNKSHGFLNSISIFLSRRRRFMSLRSYKIILCSDFFAPYREHEASL